MEPGAWRRVQGYVILNFAMLHALCATSVEEDGADEIKAFRQKYQHHVELSE
jgi:hypothetical protein